MENVEEVGRVLRDSGAEGAGVDEWEVDEEMEALEKEMEEKKTREEREKIEALPRVPVARVKDKENERQPVKSG